MHTIVKALIWAAAIIAVALVGNAGWIESETAQTLTLTLPILAVVTLGNACQYPPASGAQA